MHGQVDESLQHHQHDQQEQVIAERHGEKAAENDGDVQGHDAAEVAAAGDPSIVDPDVLRRTLERNVVSAWGLVHAAAARWAAEPRDA